MATQVKTGTKQTLADKTLDMFAEMMIEKIQNIKEDWRKPWFTDGVVT